MFPYKKRKKMTNKASLALMCKSHNYKLDPYSDEYRVGDWVISEKRRDKLVGTSVILTESQATGAYLGGTIVGFAPAAGGKCEVIFKEDQTLVGNSDAVGHRGWGSGRGVCYV
jgi:hypothetical protein